MMLSEISTALKNNSSTANISSEELHSLLERYPFSSTLRLLQSRMDLERTSLGQSNNHTLAVCSASPDTVLARLFTLPEKAVNQNENQNLNLNLNEEEVVSAIEDLNENAIQDENENLNSEDNAVENLNENELQMEGSSISEIAKAKTPDPLNANIPELNHLSDYSAWLLQLKQSEQPRQSQQSEQPRQSQQSEQPIQSLQSIQSKQTKQKPQSSESEDKAEQKKTVTKEDKSSELNKEIVSESLANLLAEQGHSKKASEMYQKLSLIIPEKSAYFAAQIEKIKGK